MTTRRWIIRILAVLSLAAIATVLVIDAVVGWPIGPIRALYGAIAGVCVAVGWLIAERRPANTVGLLLLVFGAAFAWYLPADLYLAQPGRPVAGAFAALFVTTLDAPMFIVLAMILILFPDGAFPGPRWRATVPAASIGIALAGVGYMLDGNPLPIYPAYTSPFGIGGFSGEGLVYAAYVIMMVLLVLAAVGLAVRWRRGDPVLRAQIKWILAATAFLLVAEIVNVVTFRAGDPYALTTTLASVSIALIPLAIGVAVLRYRLYAIDRIVSRGIAYAIVTAILGATFVGIVLALQAVLAPFTQEQTIAVAASTLAVFALFQPLRRRVQAAVDRRFDRTRYDADLTVRSFAARLRGDLDLGTVNAEIVGTASSAVRPTTAGIWLRGMPK